MDYSIPVYYFDGIKVKPETYDIVKVISRKLMCINEEIDYFYPDIMQIVNQIYESDGFSKQIKYQFVLMDTSFDIHNLLNSDENVPCQVYNVYEERKLKLKFKNNSS